MEPTVSTPTPARTSAFAPPVSTLTVPVPTTGIEVEPSPAGGGGVAELENEEAVLSTENLEPVSLGMDATPPEGSPLDGIPEGEVFPEKAYRVWVSPERAEQWLQRRPRIQRKVNARKVGDYVRAMRAGQWRYAHDPVTFDENGWLIQGQHRLTSIVESGEGQWMFVTLSAPESSFAVLDLGMARNAAQFLGVDGDHPKYASAVQTAAGFLWQIHAGLPYGFKGSGSWTRLPLDEQLSYMRTWSELPELAALCMTVARTKNNAPGIPPRLLLPVMAQAARTPHSDKIGLFLDGLRESMAKDWKPIGDPRLALRLKFMGRDREKLMRSTSVIDSSYSLVVRAWNAYVEDEDLDVKQLRVSTGSDRARVVGYGEAAERSVPVYDEID